MRALVGASFILAWCASSAAGQSDVVLHEYVPSPPERERFRWLQRGELPDHIALEDRILPRPELSRPTSGETYLDSASGGRGLAVQADRQTTFAGALQYEAVFNPSVVPFKRMGAFDRVATDLSLQVGIPQLRPLSLARRPTPPDRVAFWGSALLRFKANAPVPLPSVAPGAAIMSYRTEPPTSLLFFRDGADNDWVSSERGSGLVRLVWLSDAPKAYFSPQIPPLVTTSDVPPELRPRLSAEARTQARRVLEQVGVPQGPVRRQLDRLISYFRGFSEGELTHTGQSHYLALALGQRGVCRHRAYAFVITTQALGLPARYVQNEAHAFAEVLVPRSGWIRVDLGGASRRLEVLNGGDKTLHTGGPDVFPRPSGYARDANALRGTLIGLNEPRAPRRASGSPLAASPGSSARDMAEATAPAERHEQPAESPASARSRQAIAIETARSSVFRGDRLRVWGTMLGLRRAGRQRVELYLASRGLDWILLGTAITEKNGAFSTELTIPRHLPVGDYDLKALPASWQPLAPAAPR